ncbi:MAG TPA: ATP-binding protein [Moraxellaceae bacterium]|nr:ATP-binding protein [Moraxellaceae bacterium]
MRKAARYLRRSAGVARLLLLLGGWLLCLPLHAAPALVLDRAPALTALEPYLAFRCDAGTGATPESLAGLAFEDLEGRAVALGFRAEPCWFRFRVANRGAGELRLVLQVANPVLDRIDIFLPGSGLAPVRTGDGQPFAQRPLRTRFFTLPLALAPGQQQDVYLRVATTSSLNLPVMLAGEREFSARHELLEWGTGLGFGIIAGLLLYHLFLWLAVRETVFRFYVLYMAAGFFYLLCMNGIAYRLWPDATDWNGHAQPFFLLLMLSTAALFARDFLSGNAGLARGMALGLRLAGLALAGLAALQFALPLRTIYPLQAVMTLPVVAIILIAALSQLASRPRETRIFLASWALLMAMGVLLALHSLGVFPGTSFLAVLQGMELTFLLQQLMLALALAERLNTLKRERNEQQQAVLQAEAESAAKTEFLARMSHEIRTPLNALIGITDLLSGTRLDPGQKAYVDTLGDSGHALLHVINDILDYSKIAAGKVELEQADFNLLDLLDECIRIFSLKAREKSLALVCQRGRDLPVHVHGDMARLRQVLLNLLANAIKFTDHGTVQLRASLAAREGDRLRLRFEVEDSGIGIALDKLPLLFTSFTQADTSTSRQYGGTGLGLAISKELVELMGGSITVSSAPGQGSLFRFEVVLAPAVAPALGPAAATGEVDPASFAGRHVLVVEDNPVNQMVTQGFLQRLGIAATFASSGQDALALLAHPDAPAFDVVFMDCEMPGMDGFEATRRLRAWEAAQGRPRLTVVALTAHALPEHRAQCLAAGMDDYLSKPLLMPRLTEKLLEVLPARPAVSAS